MYTGSKYVRNPFWLVASGSNLGIITIAESEAMFYFAEDRDAQ